MNRKTALIIVDVQNDFLAGGSLEVKEGNEIIPVINDIRENINFGMVVLTQDYHPKGHVSFYDTHKKDFSAKLFEPYKLEDGVIQIMWPIHCVQGTYGTQFNDELIIKDTDIIVQKGTNINVDSYSGFYDNNKVHKTELDNILKTNGIEDVYIVGLAYDYCVGFTALDAVNLNYNTYIIENATKGVMRKTIMEMTQKLNKEGVEHVYYEDGKIKDDN